MTSYDTGSTLRYTYNVFSFNFRTVKNETFNGVVKEKAVAKQEYDAAKARGQSAGHIVAR